MKEDNELISLTDASPKLAEYEITIWQLIIYCDVILYARQQGEHMDPLSHIYK